MLANVTMNVQNTLRPIFLALLCLITSSLPAYGECRKSEVRQLLNDGETVTSIARRCSMPKKEVLTIFNNDRSKPKGGGLMTGTPVGECGCWGPVSPAFRQRHEMCRSGFAKPAMCSAMCMGGGYAWRGVCT